MRQWGRRSVIAAACVLGASGSVRAQEGAGVTGAVVLQLPAGGRAAALSGAYVGASGDADAIFYNPAGMHGFDAAASLSYQRHVADVGAASLGGAARIGSVVLGLGVAFLDFGDIAVVEPDPAYGGQTGIETGDEVGASELAIRLAAAVPLLDDRLSVGAAAGIVTVDLAEARRTAGVFDVGQQYALPWATIGGALRNLGGTMSGSGLADAPLPTEARLGAATSWQREDGWGGSVNADVVAYLEEDRTGLLLGLEGGLLSSAASPISAVARLGFDAASGEDALGSLRLGAGIGLGDVALDYAYQDFEAFGAVHRIGLRWAR
jgi:hypothetical protein